ncbi:MAG: CSLREA domain-containing protein [Caldilineales bacterium]
MNLLSPVKRVLVLVLMTGLLLAVGTGVAAAAGIEVNSVVDAPDAIPGDGLCETSVPGQCTLRAAVQEANALPGAETVVVPPGTYLLTLAGADEDEAATGDLDITGDTTIKGAGLPTRSSTGWAGPHLRRATGRHGRFFRPDSAQRPERRGRRHPGARQHGHDLRHAVRLQPVARS